MGNKPSNKVASEPSPPIEPVVKDKGAPPPAATHEGEDVEAAQPPPPRMPIKIVILGKTPPSFQATTSLANVFHF